MYENTDLGKIANKEIKSGTLVEVEAVPVGIREQKSWFKALIGPKWIGVVEIGDQRVVIGSDRFGGSSYFHTSYDLAMLIYASEKEIPVTFRGEVRNESRGGLTGDGNVPVLRIHDYRFGDFQTYGFGN